jgi:hypothetical protein
MIIESRELLRARSPHIALHVIVWGDQSLNADKKFFDDLREAGITVHHIPDILPNYSKQRMPYVLDKKDQHPNALAHRLIAEYVTQHIIRE